MQELLEVRCGPLLVHRFIPGTEAPHVRYVEENRIGLYEPDLFDVWPPRSPRKGTISTSCGAPASRAPASE